MLYYCARHGQSETNALGVVSGPQIDPDLTPKGVRQSEDLASTLKRNGIPIGRIITAPSKRTFQGAQIVNGLFGVELIVVEEYRERDFGKYVGQPLPDLQVLYEDNEGLETFAQMAERFSRMHPLREGDFLVGHSIATPLYLDHIYRRPMGKNFIRFENCEYKVFEL